MPCTGGGGAATELRAEIKAAPVVRGGGGAVPNWGVEVGEAVGWGTFGDSGTRVWGGVPVKMFGNEVGVGGALCGWLVMGWGQLVKDWVRYLNKSRGHWLAVDVT